MGERDGVLWLQLRRVLRKVVLVVVAPAGEAVVVVAAGAAVVGDRGRWLPLWWLMGVAMGWSSIDPSMKPILLISLSNDRNFI